MWNRSPNRTADSANEGPNASGFRRSDDDVRAIFDRQVPAATNLSLSR
jgi:hypothetical protein